MCEINPKREQFFILEFYTPLVMSTEEWNRLVTERVLKLEQDFNESGKVRVHIHDHIKEKI